MLPSCEEGENEGSIGRGKRSARCSYDKGKGKEVMFATESNSEPDDSGAHGSDGDDEGGGKGSQKYKKGIQALRVSDY
jgi:hypothetical protein